MAYGRSIIDYGPYKWAMARQHHRGRRTPRRCASARTSTQPRIGARRTDAGRGRTRCTMEGSFHSGSRRPTHASPGRLHLHRAPARLRDDGRSAGAAVPRSHSRAIQRFVGGGFTATGAKAGIRCSTSQQPAPGVRGRVQLADDLGSARTLGSDLSLVSRAESWITAEH